MGDFPEIVPSAPVVKPAQAEKVYPKLWMKRLEVVGPSPSEKVEIFIELVPMSESGEVLTDQPKTNLIPDAFGLAAKDPEFAQAMAAVIAMANKYKDTKF